MWEHLIFTILANFIYTIVLSTIVTMFHIRSYDYIYFTAESLNPFSGIFVLISVTP